jgi:uncharacterized membrane protein
MEELFKQLAGFVALALEVIAALVITVGAGEAVIGLFKREQNDARRPFRIKKRVWLGFGVWLLLGLEFELAADIIRTAITPSWTDIGQLGVIALIRTFLNYFLERDVEHYAETSEIGKSQAYQVGPQGYQNMGSR